MSPRALTWKLIRYYCMVCSKIINVVFQSYFTKCLQILVNTSPHSDKRKMEKMWHQNRRSKNNNFFGGKKNLTTEKCKYSLLKYLINIDFSRLYISNIVYRNTVSKISRYLILIFMKPNFVFYICLNIKHRLLRDQKLDYVLSYDKIYQKMYRTSLNSKRLCK